MSAAVDDPTNTRVSRSDGFDTILPDGDPRGAPALADVFDHAIQPSLMPLGDR